MAPALVETTTTNNGPVPEFVYRLDGQYKEIDLTYIDKNAEEGKTGGPAAKVSLCLPLLRASHIRYEALKLTIM